MIPIRLKLQYRSTPVRPAAAGFLHGGDVAGWLREIAGWDVRLERIRLYPVPQSRTDRTPAGVLVASGGHWPVRGGVAVPFGRIGRLYLPVNGVLVPEVSAEELDDLLSIDMTYVWHPRFGLIGFEETDSLCVAQLLAFAPPSPQRWDAASPDVALAPRLTAVLPETELDAAEAIDRGRDVIGSQKERLDQLEPLPGEPRKGWVPWGRRQARGAVARVVKWLTAAVPTAGSHETGYFDRWIDRLEEWAGRVLAELAAHGDHQMQLIGRLLRLLESDPELGLQYAIPVNEPEAFRGIAPPPKQLVRHGTDFDLGRLKRGGRVAYVEVARELRQQMIDRYRALAHRELRLKRHRRAAYIFAHLLRDYDSAARALAAGRHFREAAALYRDELERPLDAAHCLEQGGHWSEAITLYEDCRAYERAGDVWQKLGDDERARQQYRRALADLRESGDHLAAAALLEKKLGDIPEAIEELRSSWPESAQAVMCLSELLGLLGRVGRHGEAGDTLVEVRDGDLPRFNRLGLADVLAGVAATYPDRDVRDLAADSARVVVARQLDGASCENARQLTQSLARLHRDDLLLGRDCRRYVERITKAASMLRIAALPHGTMRELRKVRLRGGPTVDWRAAAWGGEAIFVAGYRGDALWLERCNRRIGSRFRAHWKLCGRTSSDRGKRTPVLLAAHPIDGRVVLIDRWGGLVDDRGERWLAAEDEMPVASRVVVSRIPAAVAVQVMASGMIWYVGMVTGGYHLSRYSAEGEPMGSWPLHGLFRNWPPDAAPTLHARDKRAYLAASHELIVVEGGEKVLSLELEQRITSLVGSPPNTRVRLLALCERGAALIWDDRDRLNWQLLGEDLVEPQASFVRGGYVVMADRHQCRLYRVRGQNVALVAQAGHDAGEIIGIAPAVHSTGWSLISRRGTVHVYGSDPA